MIKFLIGDSIDLFTAEVKLLFSSFLSKIRRIGVGLIIFSFAFSILYLSFFIFILALFFHLAGLSVFVAPAVWCGVLSLILGLIFALFASFLFKNKL